MPGGRGCGRRDCREDGRIPNHDPWDRFWALFRFLGEVIGSVTVSDDGHADSHNSIFLSGCYGAPSPNIRNIGMFMVLLFDQTFPSIIQYFPRFPFSPDFCDFFLPINGNN